VKSKQPPSPPASRFDTDTKVRPRVHRFTRGPPNTDAPSDTLQSKSRLKGALVLI
jgi:hypothetical protein